MSRPSANTSSPMITLSGTMGSSARRASAGGEVAGAVGDEVNGAHRARVATCDAPALGRAAGAAARRTGCGRRRARRRLIRGGSCSLRWRSTLARIGASSCGHRALATPPPKTTQSQSSSAVALTTARPSHSPTSSHTAWSSISSARRPKRRAMARPLAIASRQPTPPQSQRRAAGSRRARAPGGRPRCPAARSPAGRRGPRRCRCRSTRCSRRASSPRAGAEVGLGERGAVGVVLDQHRAAEAVARAGRRARGGASRPTARAGR